MVCLHSGVFLLSQHLTFVGRTDPAPANRFVRHCREHAVCPRFTAPSTQRLHKAFLDYSDTAYTVLGNSTSQLCR